MVHKGTTLQERPRSTHRLVAPAKSFAQRFLYMGLVSAAFGLMLLGKADAVLMERVRAHVADAISPVLDAVSRRKIQLQVLGIFNYRLTSTAWIASRPIRQIRFTVPMLTPF